MFKISASQKHVMPQPHAGWSLVPGSNHFEGEMPDQVAEHLHALQARGAVKVEVLNDKGESQPWDPSVEPADSK